MSGTPRLERCHNVSPILLDLWQLFHYWWPVLFHNTTCIFYFCLNLMSSHPYVLYKHPVPDISRSTLLLHCYNNLLGRLFTRFSNMTLGICAHWATRALVSSGTDVVWGLVCRVHYSSSQWCSVWLRSRLCAGQMIFSTSPLISIVLMDFALWTVALLYWNMSGLDQAAYLQWRKIVILQHTQTFGYLIYNVMSKVELYELFFFFQIHYCVHIYDFITFLSLLTYSALTYSAKSVKYSAEPLKIFSICILLLLPNNYHIQILTNITLLWNCYCWLMTIVLHQGRGFVCVPAFLVIILLICWTISKNRQRSWSEGLKLCHNLWHVLGPERCFV